MNDDDMIVDLETAKQRRGDADPRSDAEIMEVVEKALAETQSEKVALIASKAELFHNPDGIAFATFAVESHKETWPVRHKVFKQWLVHSYYKDHGAPSCWHILRSAFT